MKLVYLIKEKFYEIYGFYHCDGFVLPGVCRR